VASLAAFLQPAVLIVTAYEQSSRHPVISAEPGADRRWLDTAFCFSHIEAQC